MPRSERIPTRTPANSWDTAVTVGAFFFNANGKKFKGAARSLKDYDKEGKLKRKETNYNNNRDSDLDSDSSDEENNYNLDSSSEYEEFNHIKSDKTNELKK